METHEFGTQGWFEQRFENVAEKAADGWGQQWRGSQKFRLALCFATLKPYLASGTKKFLDIGAGICDFSRLVHNIFPEYQIYACDISENAVKYVQNTFKYIDAKVNILPKVEYNSQVFGYISALDVLYYLNDNDRKQSFDEIARCLTQGGIFFFTTPINRGSRYFDEADAITLVAQRFKILRITYNYANFYTHFENLLMPFALLGTRIETHATQNKILQKLTSFFTTIHLFWLFLFVCQLFSFFAKFILKRILFVRIISFFSQFLFPNATKSHLIIVAEKYA